MNTNRLKFKRVYKTMLWRSFLSQIFNTKLLKMGLCEEFKKVITSNSP